MRALVWAAALVLAFHAAGMSESPPLPKDKIPQPIRDAVAAPDRPDADKALDPGRQPEQMLAFFGISPGQKVADLFAGGGYTTELLARVVGQNGRVYSQEPIFPPELKSIEDSWQQRLMREPMAVVFPVHKNIPDDGFLPAPDGSLDAVVINMNYHDLVLRKVDRDKLNAVVFRTLRRGGVYGIVDHSAKPGSGDAALELHRIDQDFLTKEVEKAGFKLAAASSALRHPEDDRSWSTSPRTAGEKRGTSDRFMLRFVKP
ncbi:MAG TPA: SAM-dependent methyltransferase [Myxococcota bacterium]|nr:SAM-dependent methyltransferase [Myxococcota bacterium]